MLSIILLALCTLGCAAMDSQEPKVAETDNHLFVTVAPRENSLEKTFELLISTGSLDDFKKQMNKAEELAFNDLEHLLMNINNRKRALSVVSQNRGNIWNHVEQIKAAIKKIAEQEKARKKSDEEFFGKIPVMDRYIGQEEAKLAEIEKVLNACKDQYAQEWFTVGEKRK